MVNLYEHQKIALSYLEYNDSFGLFMDQGTGKTLPTLIHLYKLKKNKEIDNALVVCPKPVIEAWHNNMSLLNEEMQETLKSTLTIINYDMVWRGDRYKQKWDCIVLDESHKIKHRNAKRAKFLLQRSLQSKYRYILSGTPITNGRLENIWSQFTFLKPKLRNNRIISEWLGSYREFEDRYCILDKFYKPYKYVNIHELQQIIGEHSYRVTKKECLDLPDRVYEIWSVDLGEPALYKELHKTSVIQEFDYLAENPLARLTKLRQICSGFIMIGQETRALKNEKISILRDFLDDWDQKLVIYAQFRPSITAISELLSKMRIPYIVLDGQQRNKGIWKEFQSNEDIQVAVCQYQSGSEGIDLFKADTVIFYEPTLSSELFEQSQDRIHRIGQTNKCTYISLITKKTIEEAIYKALFNYMDFDERLFREYMREYQKGVRYR